MKLTDKELNILQKKIDHILDSDANSIRILEMIDNFLEHIVIGNKNDLLPHVNNSTYEKCNHLNKKEIYRDYPDGYIRYECLECGERIYKDMYND